MDTSSSSQPAEEATGHEEEHDEAKREFLVIFGPAYATNAQFWKAILFSSLPQGILLAFIALAFFNFYTALAQATWLTHEYEEALHFRPSDELGEGDTHTAGEDPIHILRLGNGEWWYVAMLAGAGLAVGLTKTLWTLIVPQNHAFPRALPSFLDDLRGLHAHDIFLPIPMLICSAISIGLGGSAGPEAAMGVTGTALGTFMAKRWRLGKYQAVAYKKNDGDTTGETTDPRGPNEVERKSYLSKALPDFSHDKKLMVMDGIAAAFGALFPAQYLSPMIIFELGGHWGKGSSLSVTETLARTGFSASVAYIVFVSIQDFTLLKQLSLPTAAYNLLPEIDIVNMFEGAVLGIICGLVGIIGLIILGLGKTLGNKVHDTFDKLGDKYGLTNRRISLGLLLTPVVGGTFVGLLCVAVPLCLSDGADQLGSVVALGKALGPGEVALAAFVKLLCLSFTVGFGFVGGPIFPFIFTGACVGTVATLLIDGLPVVVAVPACLVAVPCAFIPAIFTFTTLASMLLALGGAATSPVFFACICSYTIICGFGLLHNLFDQARASTNESNAKSTESGELNITEEGQVNIPEVKDKPLNGEEGAEAIEPSH